MPRLLPAIATREDYCRVRHQPADEWLPALRALGERHGLPEESVQRFAAGENPVFGLGEQLVVKLVPNLWVRAVQREAESLRFLADKTTLPVAHLVAEGRMEDWSYLVSTRLPGTPLDRVWPRLNSEEKERLAGDPLFDLTAPTVLLAPGRAEAVRSILAGYGGAAALDLRTLQRRLMAPAASGVRRNQATPSNRPAGSRAGRCGKGNRDRP